MLALVALAALRGLLLGVAREVVSLASLAGAVLAVRFLSEPAGRWLVERRGGDVDPLLGQVAAGAVLVVAALVLGAIVGRVLRRGARAVGLGALDRAAGGLLGAGEGALVAAVVLALAAALVGRESSVLRESKAFAALEGLERAARRGPEELPPVASPPRGRR